MKSYVIHFIRHGMTLANMDGRYAGITDIPVCEEGLLKLDNLKKNYNYPSVKRLFSSPLLRCRQTSEVIFPHLKYEVIDGLKEMNFGDFENKTPKELSKNNDFQSWIANNFTGTPPKGENSKEFNDRILKTFKDIVLDLMEHGDESAVIVSHGGVIMRILNEFSVDERRPFEWLVDNGCGYSVRITPSIWMRGEKFEVFDLIPHGIDSVSANSLRKKLFLK